MSVVVFRVITIANSLRLGAVTDYWHRSSMKFLMLNLAQMVNRSTSAPLLANCKVKSGHTIE
jgi:alpha-L-arabinofuranosidase